MYACKSASLCSNDIIKCCWVIYLHLRMLSCSVIHKTRHKSWFKARKGAMSNALFFHLNMRENCLNIWVGLSQRISVYAVLICLNLQVTYSSAYQRNHRILFRFAWPKSNKHSHNTSCRKVRRRLECNSTSRTKELFCPLDLSDADI